MTVTAPPPAATITSSRQSPLALAEGVSLLGPVHGCGYRDGAALVRRADGQMVQLGPLMYALLECIDGRRDGAALAAALSAHLGRRVQPEHVRRLAEKLAAQGLLAGSEHRAPPRRNPLLALRWKVLVTNPVWTRRLTAPLGFLFRPWVMWPVLAAFAVVFWFVLIHKGVASATAEAFHRPGLLLLVFALAILSAGFHELGHAAACRYGGATPGGMGMGLYLVWPAFYTDVTDTYRLPKRERLRVDLAGLYFNAVVAVVTMGVWLVWRTDALLLLVALQLLQMVKQLSPVIRADGYHILSDATGVPDLYSHMGPTIRRLLPGHRDESSALSGRARTIVTVWVLVMVPVLLSLTLSAVILLPRLATSAWDSGRHIALAIPADAGQGRIIDLLAAIVQLLALSLPVLGSILVTQKVVRTTVGRARGWSRGSIGRQTVAAAVALAFCGGLAWAWWPSGQYQPVRAHQGGTLGSLVRMVAAPQAIARPQPAVQPVQLAPGTHLAVSMIPVGGASRRHPALFVIAGRHGQPAVAILSTTAPPVHGAPHAAGTTIPTTTTVPAGSIPPTGSSSPGAGATGAAGGAAQPGAPASRVDAAAFPFTLPKAPGPGDSQAVAVGTRNGGVTYDVAYSLVTVGKGAPVTDRNSAYAFASCHACTTVAASVQVVLVVGRSRVIAPVNTAEALNASCPACTTTALADQIVVTLRSQPSQALVQQLETTLRQLNALDTLGAAGTPAAVSAAVAAVQQQIDQQLQNSGLLANPPASTTTTSTSTSTSTTPTNGASTTSTTSTTPSAQAPTSTSTGTSGSSASGTPSGTTGTATTPGETAGTTTATTTAPTATTTTSATTTAAPASGSTASTTPTSTATAG